jgi:hypothetical protein
MHEVLEQYFDAEGGWDNHEGKNQGIPSPDKPGHGSARQHRRDRHWCHGAGEDASEAAGVGPLPLS